MNRAIHVHFLPSAIPVGALPGGTAVIIDILRASTTIITALRNGAQSVTPCASVDEARNCKDQLGDTGGILGGERGGLRVKGFDCGNSPNEYPRGLVQERQVVFTTTNGTHALLQSTAADVICIGAFVNLSQLSSCLLRLTGPIHLVCAGTNGAVTGEDVLFAGAVVWSMLKIVPRASRSSREFQIEDSARIALSHWEMQIMLNLESPTADYSDDGALKAALSQGVSKALRHTQGGRNLLELGYANDLELCSQIDAAPVLPRFDKDLQVIHL